jgi:hypothetical protein
MLGATAARTKYRIATATQNIGTSYLGIAWLIELGWLTEPGR